MKSRPVLLVLALSLAVCAGAQDRREQAVDEAPIVEAMLRVAFPDAPVKWQGDLSVQLDGDWFPVAGPGYHRVRTENGSIAVAALELPSKAKALVDKMQRFESVGDSAAPTNVVVVRVAGDGSVGAHRAGILDVDARVTECHKLGAKEYSAASWPRLIVTYSGMYQGADWIGSVQWVGEWDTASGQLVTRTPVEYWKKTQGGIETGGAIAIQRIGPDLIQLSSASGNLGQYSCGEACKIPPEAVLNTQ